MIPLSEQQLRLVYTNKLKQHKFHIKPRRSDHNQRVETPAECVSEREMVTSYWTN